jgi:hypothetical protein
MPLSRNAKIAVGVVGIVVIAAVALILLKPTGVTTTVVLRDNARGQCEIADKEAEVVVKKGGPVTWRIDNQCSGTGELVTIGNLRRVETTTADHCREATDGGPPMWPFREPFNDLQRRQGTAEIRLTTKQPADLPAERRPVYHYDICSGPNADRKADPRLVLED